MLARRLHSLPFWKRLLEQSGAKKHCVSLASEGALAVQGWLVQGMSAVSCSFQEALSKPSWRTRCGERVGWGRRRGSSVPITFCLPCFMRRTWLSATLAPILVPIKIALRCQPFPSHFLYIRHSLDSSKPSKDYRSVSSFGILRLMEKCFWKRRPSWSFSSICTWVSITHPVQRLARIKPIGIVRTTDKSYVCLSMFAYPL